MIRLKNINVKIQVSLIGTIQFNIVHQFFLVLYCIQHF